MIELSDAEILRRLDNVADWPALIKKMIAYGVWLAKIEYKWRAGTMLPKGNDIKDVVYTTINKLYSGERTWDPDRVSLEKWLRNNIRSEMNNLFKAAYTKSGEVREVALTSGEDGPSDAPLDYKAVTDEEGWRQLPNPESILLEEEERRRRDIMIEALCEASEGDELAEEVVYSVLEGCERKPRFLASRLGRPKHEIVNALRRIDRRVERIAAEKGHDVNR